MNYQNETLPEGAVKAGSSRLMNEDSVVPGILKKHLAPKGKWGYLVVDSGSVDFVWEDEPDQIITAAPDHPIVIFPERFHHVIITGPVQFTVEFYIVEEKNENTEQTGDRPGQAFLD